MYSSVKKLALGLAVMMVWSGCAKQKAETLQAGETTVATASQATLMSQAISPGNEANPFDQVGRDHNTLLSRLAEKIRTEGDTSAKVKRQYFIEVAGGGKVAAARYDQWMARFKAYTQDPAFQLKALSDRFRRYYTRLGQQTATLTTLEQYGSFVASVKKLESEILADKVLSRQDQKSLLVATSIARYSAAWWQARLGQTKNGDEAARKSFFNRLLRFHAAVNGDIMGGVLGMFTRDNVEEIVEGAAAFSWQFAWWVENKW